MKPLTWQQFTPIVLAVMGIGLALNLWRPLLLAPPYLDATWVVYAILGLAWLPVLGICVLLKLTGRITLILLAVIGMLVASIGFCVGPTLPTGAWGTRLKCQVTSSTAQRIQYECVVDRMFLIDKYVVEGIPGLPVVWLVSHETVNL